MGIDVTESLLLIACFISVFYCVKLTPPWLTKSIIKACHKKSRLLKICKKTKTPLAKTNYTKYKNMLKQIIRKEEKNYNDKEFKIRTPKKLGS